MVRRPHCNMVISQKAANLRMWVRPIRRLLSEWTRLLHMPRLLQRMADTRHFTERIKMSHSQNNPTRTSGSRASTQERGAVVLHRVVSQQKCNNCWRPGLLVSQHVTPRQYDERTKTYVDKPWVFRFYLCRWHIAAENRRKRKYPHLYKGHPKTKSQHYVPDDVLLANA